MSNRELETTPEPRCSACRKPLDVDECFRRIEGYERNDGRDMHWNVVDAPVVCADCVEAILETDRCDPNP